jgi:sulfonate transport system substrate-binding protein
MTPMPVSAPVLLARELGWFTKAGLKVELKEYSLGKLALEDLSLGKLDLACAAVTPLVYRSLGGEDFRIVSTIASSTGMVALVARKDAGIHQLSDLAGKRVALSKGTSGEFFFDTLRVLHRLPKAQLQVEDRSLEALLQGIQDGSVDVVSLWEPQITQLERAMPGRLTSFYGNGLYTFTWNLVALPSTINNRGEEIRTLLKVLIDAAAFVEKQPRAAQERLRQLGDTGHDLARLLEQVRCRPVLSQDLLVQLEAEARWVMARDGKTNSQPNFLRFIDRSLLEAVDPSAVTLIK